jgi:hypothetical protein
LGSNCFLRPYGRKKLFKIETISFGFKVLFVYDPLANKKLFKIETISFGFKVLFACDPVANKKLKSFL